MSDQQTSGWKDVAIFTTILCLIFLCTTITFGMGLNNYIEGRKLYNQRFEEFVIKIHDLEENADNLARENANLRRQLLTCQQQEGE